MSTCTVPVRLRRGFCDEAANAFAELVICQAATISDIETGIAFWRNHFSTIAYSVTWTTTEKFAWLFAAALSDADEKRQLYWLESVNKLAHGGLKNVVPQVA